MEPLRSSRRIGAALACAALLLVGGARAAALATARSGDADAKDLARRVPAILAKAVPSDTTADPTSTAARQLAALGPDVIPLLLDVLDHGSASGASALTGEQREATLSALSRFDRAAVILVLESRVLPTTPARERAGVLRVLELLGRGADLPLAVRAAAPSVETKDGARRRKPGRPPQAEALAVESAPVLESELASCAAALLARDARGLREVPAAFEADSLPVRAALVQALGRSAQREALDVLAELLGEEPRLEAAMLSEIGRLAAPLAPPFGERLRTEVRTRLSAQDFQVLREAALVVGRLRDDAATPQLVALLGHARAAVRDSAHAALRELTGLGFPNDAERWRAWLASEQAWFERSFGSVAYRLRSRDRRDVLAALAELVQHRYRRRELAAEAARLLDDVDHHVRRATCASLRTLGTCADLEPLIRCLDDENTAVAAEAHGALLALTGAELDASSAAWREALDAGSLRVR